MKDVAARLSDYEWTYADRDSIALDELARRIVQIGKTKDKFLKYSELVDGITFRLSNVNNGQPFDIREWNNLERAIIGSFLGKIAAESYLEGEFLASALVIGVESNGPGEGFYTLATEVGLLKSTNEDAKLGFWFEQVRRARAWYSTH